MFLLKKLCCAVLSICFCCSMLSACIFTSENDTIMKASGVPANTAVMKVNGAEIPAEVYCYWLSNSITYLDAEAYDSKGIVWTDEQDGMTTEEYIKNDAVETVKMYQVVEENAQKNGCKLTEEDQAYLDEMRSYFIENMGGDEQAYKKELQLLGVSEKTLFHFSEVSLLYEKLLKTLYGEGSENAPTKEALLEYANENVKAQGYQDFNDFIAKTGYMYAKHILIATVDENQQKLPEEEIAKKKKQAEELLQQLQNSEDPIAKFDQLMEEYSEDPGLKSSPDGYQFKAGEMYEPFEKATKELGENEISDIVETDAGYHIILRRPNLDMFLTPWGNEQFQKQIETWMEDAEVEYTSAFDKIDSQSFYEKMRVIYKEGHPEESPAPSVSQSPEESQIPNESPSANVSQTPEVSPEGNAEKSQAPETESGNSTAEVTPGSEK